VAKIPSRSAPRKPPPVKRVAADDALAEVERAMSLLDGRHPDHQRATREMAHAAELRRVQLEEAAKEARRRTIRRVAYLLLVLAAIGAASFVGVGLLRRARDTSTLLSKASAPWLARGFVVVASSATLGGGHAEASVEPGCFVAVTSADHISVERDTGRAQGAAPIGWCSCVGEHVSANAPIAAGVSGGVQILRVDPSVIGGASMFPRFDPRPAGFAPGGDECSDAQFDAWLATRAPPSTPLDDAALSTDPLLAPLGRSGFHGLAESAPAAPFVIAVVPAHTCAVATARHPGIELRVTGGDRVVHASRAIAWCASDAATSTVWSDDASTVRVVTIASPKIGGMLGVREALARAKLSDAAEWVPPAARGDDAADALRASLMTDIVVAPDGIAPKATSNERRIVSVSRDATTELAIDAPAGGYYLCAPPLDPGVTNAVCVESAPHEWRARGGAKIGIAYAPAPFWLASFSTIEAPAALSGALDLILLARRLAPLGFEPTILGGATETARGVDVLGRVGEDAIVAVGLQPRAPWLLTYSDGPAWDVTDAPRIIPLAPLTRISLGSKPPPLASKNERRTVVFRRAVKK
jgi:hypothetical protein